MPEQNCVDRIASAYAVANEWIMGNEFTLVDPYALVFYGWGVRGGFPMKDLSAYTAWQERMMKRPTVRKTFDTEQNVSTS